MQSRNNLMMVWLVAAHTIVSLIHGAAHVGLGIPATTAENLFRVGVIGLGPWVGLAVTWSRSWSVWGQRIIFLTLGMSLIYGAINHFVLSGDDHIRLLGTNGWGVLFTITALLLFITEGWGMLLASSSISHRAR